MLYLALSCLQGRPAQEAFDELSLLGPDGIQLTPGNTPTPLFAAHVAKSKLPHLTHHGFSWTLRKRQVWDSEKCLCRAHTVHPPHAEVMSDEAWQCWQEGATEKDPGLEVMPPGRRLGTGAELERAMDLELKLALDFSHLHIQRSSESISSVTLRRLLDYGNISEIHVSANNGTLDNHQPLTSETYGLGFARERMGDTPVVLECFMHNLSRSERCEQLRFLGV